MIAGSGGERSLPSLGFGNFGGQGGCLAFDDPNLVFRKGNLFCFDSIQCGCRHLDGRNGGFRGFCCGGVGHRCCLRLLRPGRSRQQTKQQTHHQRKGKSSSACVILRFAPFCIRLASFVLKMRPHFLISFYRTQKELSTIKREK